MGAELPPRAAFRRALGRAELDPTAKLVGCALAEFMDGAGRAQVSRSTLAAWCGFASVDPVKRAVRRLELSGLLGVDRVKGGRHAANRYQAHYGGWTAPVEGGWTAPVGDIQRVLQRPETGAGEHHVLRGLQDQEQRAPARATGGEGQERIDGDGLELVRAARREFMSRLEARA